MRKVKRVLKKRKENEENVGGGYILDEGGGTARKAKQSSACWPLLARKL